MKKILFSFMSLMLCGFMAQAQNWGYVQGQVVDASQNPIPGVAVFSYGNLFSFFNSGKDISSYRRVSYSNNNGAFWMQYIGVSAGDTAVVGVLDSNMNVTWGTAEVTKSIDTITINIQLTGAVPHRCNALVSAFSDPGGVLYEAVALRDSLFSNIPWPTQVIHDWTFSDGYVANFPEADPNIDTVWRPLSSFSQHPDSISYCYQRTNICSPICKGSWTPTPSGHSCSADFFVDSVNSINFQGQIVVWENSTTDSMANIIGYRWDFGDGSPIVNQQYPSHTYADTGVYEVCLTIISVEQTATSLDTCISTHCDSIGFDSQGNLIYKSSGPGFTINVVDPATVGQSEVDLVSHFKLFPNPTSDEATLSWEAEMQVEHIDVFSVSGQVVKSIEPSSTSVSLNDMNTGVYIIRVSGDQGDTTLRMIVQ